jgi:hypothetical protein
LRPGAEMPKAMSQPDESSLYAEMRESIRADQERAGKRRPQTVLANPVEPRRQSRLKQFVQRLRRR